MLSDEHFKAIRRLREQAVALNRACTEMAGTSSFFHIAFDPKVVPSLSRAEEHLLGKLRAIQ